MHDVFPNIGSICIYSEDLDKLVRVKSVYGVVNGLHSKIETKILFDIYQYYTNIRCNVQRWDTRTDLYDTENEKNK